VRSRQQRQLRASASRLMRPKLTACLTHWRRDWEAAEVKAAIWRSMSAAERSTSQLRERDEREAALRAQVAAAEAERTRLEGELAAAREAMAAGKGKEYELQQQMEETLALEREKRVAHLQQLAARRIGQQGLAKGWNAWFEMWEVRSRQQRQLRASASRLMRPKLTACMAYWRHDWELCSFAQRELHSRVEHESLMAQLRISQSENQMARLSYEDELRAYIEKNKALRSSDFVGREEFETLQEELAAATKRLKEQQEAAALATEAVERDASSRVEAAEKRAQESLERLLAQQRARFEAELADMASMHGKLERSMKEKQAQFDDELGEKLHMIIELEQLLKELRAKLEAETAEFAAAQRAWALERDGLQAKAKPAPAKSEKKEIKTEKERKKGTILGQFDFDESSDVPYDQQLAKALKTSGARVLDLFREMDVNGDGEVSRDEFHRAMPILGLEVPKADIDKLFNTWDPDGSGIVTFAEMKKLLRVEASGKVKDSWKQVTDGMSPNKAAGTPASRLQALAGAAGKKGLLKGQK